MHPQVSKHSLFILPHKVMSFKGQHHVSFSVSFPVSSLSHYFLHPSISKESIYCCTVSSFSSLSNYFSFSFTLQLVQGNHYLVRPFRPFYPFTIFRYLPLPFIQKFPFYGFFFTYLDFTYLPLKSLIFIFKIINFFIAVQKEKCLLREF